eukprot:11952922-Prorocentrum_lima.AAC.1
MGGLALSVSQPDGSASAPRYRLLACGAASAKASLALFSGALEVRLARYRAASHPPGAEAPAGSLRREQHTSNAWVASAPWAAG